MAIKPITDSADGANDVLERLKFGAETTNVNVDRSAVGAVDITRSP
jgi:hypothetical protein